MTLWLQALKLWNQTQSKWCIPKKGTAGYQEVRKIMEQLKAKS